jgi:hypothetical protein
MRIYIQKTYTVLAQEATPLDGGEPSAFRVAVAKPRVPLHAIRTNNSVNMSVNRCAFTCMCAVEDMIVKQRVLLPENRPYSCIAHMNHAHTYKQVGA